MDPRHDADVIILGGGLAGLTLAARLARSGARLGVRIVEPRASWSESRSWCFWAPLTNPLAGFVSHRWQRWTFSEAAGERRAHAVPGLLYQQLESGAVFARLLAQLEDAPDVRLETGVTAHAIAPGRSGLLVETSAGRLAARHVIDTRPPVAEGARGPLLFQCFAGRTVRTGTSTGTGSAEVELMTDMRADAGGLVFDYVLPLGDGLARAESVRWAFRAVPRDTLARDLDAMLARRGWTGEGAASFGVLPTGLPRERAARPAGLVRAAIGTGGWRAGAGHALLRIEAWAAAASTRLLSGLPPPVHRDPGRFQHHFTRSLVRVLEQRPDRLDAVVMRLATRLPPASLVRLMSGCAGFADAARVIACLDRRDLARTLPLARTRA